MATLWTFLLSAALPLVLRVLAGLGIGWVTFTGFQSAFDALKQHFLDSYSGIPGTIAQLFGLAGIPDAFSMILGAIAVRSSYMITYGAVSRLTRLPVNNGP